MDHVSNEETVGKPGEMNSEVKSAVAEGKNEKKENNISYWVKKNIKLLAIACILLVAAIGYVVLNKSNNAKVGKAPPPDPENVLLATVGTRKIYRNDVRGIALEVYLGSAVTDKVIKNTLNTAVERAILDNEAVLKGITIPKQQKKALYYDLLKAKVIEGQVQSVSEQDISWWIPPIPYEQKPEFVVQRQNQVAMSNEIESRFKKGDDPYTVAQDMVKKYPMFEGTLGYNGANIQKGSKTIIPGDRTLEFDASDSAKPFFKLLYSMNSGETKKGIWNDGSGGAVIKVSKSNKGSNIDYNSWLSEMIKTSVIYNTSEINKL